MKSLPERLGFRFVAVSLVLVGLLAAGVALAQAPPLDPEILKTLAGWKTRLNLTEAQNAQLKGFADQLVKQLEPLAAKLDTEDQAQKKAAVKESLAALNTFQTSVQGVLTPAQKQAWEAIKQEAQVMLQNVAGGKMAARLQQKYKLDEAQVKACTPVLAKEVGVLIDTVEGLQASRQSSGEEGGGPRARRGQLRQLREAKGAMDETESALQKIFTPEQWQQYQADKAKQREQMREQIRGARG